jgi:hypothetical protein
VLPAPSNNVTDAHFLHGTLYIFIKNACNLGSSAAVAGAPCSMATRPADVVACTIIHGARFVGKKMLNAVRATNNVRIDLTAADEGILVDVDTMSKRLHVRAGLSLAATTLFENLLTGMISVSQLPLKPRTFDLLDVVHRFDTP